ncbi:uncharacterized protein RSE6_09182 [Rhynchosporium secalis]|uniref:Uncharacterized protein n=1 Tax=Rhynchosporium secalis TaxID=38038 RepID=A0A1E1MHD7_RHYSE|nr:uncharacterized protein RSE6_09182 [Rhynchosporium secalis]
MHRASPELPPNRPFVLSITWWKAALLDAFDAAAAAIHTKCVARASWGFPGIKATNTPTTGVSVSAELN